MRRIPMPSPTGRNAANLFLEGRAASVLRAAYDAAEGLPDDERMERILEFLKEKLSAVDFALVSKILDGEDVPLDEPGSMGAMERGGGVAQDARNRRIARRVTKPQWVRGPLPRRES